MTIKTISLHEQNTIFIFLVEKICLKHQLVAVRSTLFVTDNTQQDWSHRLCLHVHRSK